MASSLHLMAACFLLCAILRTTAVESPAESHGDVDIKAFVSQVMELKAEMEKLKSAQRVTSVGSPASPEETVDDSLKAEVKLLRSEVDRLKAAPKIRRSVQSGSRQGGASYIRWGRTTCEGDAIEVYRGYAAGAHHYQGGGGSNFLCLPENPQWGKYFPGVYSWAGMIYGVEYEIWDQNHVFSTINNGGNFLDSYPSPCVACIAPHAITVMMIPARTQCPAGWNLEYHGYIVSEATNSAHSRHRSQYTCWDHAPETAHGGTGQHQNVIYAVQVGCGSLPCSKYVTGWELACVVCSR